MFISFIFKNNEIKNQNGYQIGTKQTKIPSFN